MTRIFRSLPDARKKPLLKAAYWTVKTFLPLARLEARTFLPPAEAILARKPWTFAWERFFGWNVIFIIDYLLSSSFESFKDKTRCELYVFFGIKSSFFLYIKVFCSCQRKPSGRAHPFSWIQSVFQLFFQSLFRPSFHTYKHIINMIFTLFQPKPPLYQHFVKNLLKIRCQFHSSFSTIQ